jgi:hypothetical protein
MSIRRRATSVELSTCTSWFRISDKVTINEVEKQRACVCVCVRERKRERERECVCVFERERERDFAANLVNILQRHFTCLTKHTGRTVWTERSAMSGLSVLKRAECRSVKIPSQNCKNFGMRKAWAQMLGYCKVARYREESRRINWLKAAWDGRWKVRYVTIVTPTPKMETRVFVEASVAFCQTKFASPIRPL